MQWEETHDPDTEKMMLPLIRLKVETTGAKEMTNPVRFGQDYIGRVANPRDILQYYRKKQTGDRSRSFNHGLGVSTNRRIGEQA